MAIEPAQHAQLNLDTLEGQIRLWASELGFADVGVSDVDLRSEESAYRRWLENKFQGDMQWLQDNLDLRFEPSRLHAGSCRIISLRMNYLPPEAAMVETLKHSQKAYISRYALGRDYHRLLRKRLKDLVKRIEHYVEQHTTDTALSQRVFVDSAPVLERKIAEKAGLGWIGKHTLLLNENEGSWFFLGEIFTNLPLPLNRQRADNRCGSCEACLKVCPTDAFVEPYVLDASRCISYLTIEHEGVIPEELRSAIGNRIFGCDDCQVICPWNKTAPVSGELDFRPRHGLNSMDLLELFAWSEEEYLQRSEGSPLRRAGYRKWLRNIAIALGNAPQDLRIVEALQNRLAGADTVLAEHIEWAIERQQTPQRKRGRKIRRTQ